MHAIWRSVSLLAVGLTSLTAGAAPIYRALAREHMVGYYPPPPAAEIGDVLESVGQSGGPLNAVKLALLNAPDVYNPTRADLLAVDLVLHVYADPNDLFLLDPNAALVRVDATATWEDPNTPGVGLAPGAWSEVRLPVLEAGPESPVELGCRFAVTLRLADPRWGIGSTGEAAIGCNDPPEIGQSTNLLWVNDGIDPANFYDLGDAYRNLALEVELDEPVACRAISVIYANTRGVQGFAVDTSAGDITSIGDDVQPVGGGRLATAKWALLNLPASGVPGHLASALESVDLTVSLRRVADDEPLGAFTRSVDLRDPNGVGLEPGLVAYLTLDNLESEQIIIDTDNLWVEVTPSAGVWTDPEFAGRYSTIALWDPNGCTAQVWTPIANPIGQSTEAWLRNSSPAPPLGDSCDSVVASFYLELAVIDDVGCALVGDLNCDGDVNFGDIDPFVLALIDGDAYAEAFPACSVSCADVNHDSAVNFGDIDPFVALLTGG